MCNCQQCSTAICLIAVPAEIRIHRKHLCSLDSFYMVKACTSSRLLLSIFIVFSWWRHQMETFSELLAICAGNSPVPGEFPAQRPVTRSFDVFFDLRLNKRLSKQPWGWWFETPAWSLWRHRNVASLFTDPCPTLLLLAVNSVMYRCVSARKT